MHFPLGPLVVAASLLHCVSSQALSLSDVSTVTSRLAEGATERYCFIRFSSFNAQSVSWELGTRAESLLELNVPNFSVFSSEPPPTSVPSNTTSAIAPVFSIAHNVVSALKNATGPQGLVNGDGAAGDPASIGVAVLLANWTGQGAGMFVSSDIMHISQLSVQRTG
jgi:hypothetical protein